MRRAIILLILLGCILLAVGLVGCKPHSETEKDTEMDSAIADILAKDVAIVLQKTSGGHDSTHYPEYSVKEEELSAVVQDIRALYMQKQPCRLSEKECNLRFMGGPSSATLAEGGVLIRINEKGQGAYVIVKYFDELLYVSADGKMKYYSVSQEAAAYAQALLDRTSA